MAAKLDIATPGIFKVIGEQNLCTTWDQYLKRFDYFVKASNITKDEQKRALLLHVSGTEVQDVFESLGDTGTTFDAAVQKLTDYFRPKKNVAFERHLFRQARQEHGETMDNFIVRLSKLSVSCDFPQKEDMIRDQIIDQCRSTELRKKLLAEANLTLDKAQTIARTFELSESHAKQMETNGNGQAAGSSNQEVNKLRKQPKYRGNRRQYQHDHTTGNGSNQGTPPTPRQGRFTRTTAVCYRCGDKGHYGKSCVKTKGVTCRKCGRKNHYAKMCQTKSVNLVSETEMDNKSDYDRNDDVREEIFHLSAKQDATIPLNIEGKILNILIDSGASVNALDSQTFYQLKSRKLPVEKSNAQIYPYGSNKPIDLMGKTKLQVNVAGRVHEVEFQVIKGTGRPLIGCKTATELGLLHVGLINNVSSPCNETTDAIIKSFSDRFTGLGKLKDFQLRLYIDESVKPIAQPARKIPFKMRSQVERKLQELEDQGVIEKVEGPTPWVSALVPIPKKDGDVRLCVDMRQANKAVQRERFPMPNVEETLEQMNGASLFSKLDLRQSFHQIVLEDNSRYITTFACHKGLYRYQRLFFGINSAPETHQRIIQQIIQDIPGCKNIADDIIIFAQNQEEHNKILKMLLTRLRDKNLTLNKDKCEFNKTELIFMGHTLSHRGLKIDENKVRAVMATEKPKNPSEVKSFLGLVNFCSKFIANFATLAEPLRKLTRKDVVWQWTEEQQRAFDTLKQSLVSTDVMAYYNPEAETNLVVDGSPFGVGAILNQKQADGNFRPVAYASRTLTAVERRYSQTEREALAILFSIQRFRVYLYGMHFTVYTDHRPLERMFTRSHEAPARIQNWVLKFSFIHFPSSTNRALQILQIYFQGRRYATAMISALKQHIKQSSISPMSQSATCH